MNRIGVAIVGVNGAVASTVIAGVELMKRGLAPRIGMVTEKVDARIAESLTELLDFAPLDSLVFGGWDLQFANVYAGALHHKVLPEHVLDKVKPELERIRPWPAVFGKAYVQKLKGENVTRASSYREEIAILERNIEAFKREHDLREIVIVNLASTERFLEVQPVHQSLRAFEAGLDANDAAISPAMRYFYVANKLHIPYCNFTPSLTNVPALSEQANETGTPFAGMDGKTGQTLIKTALGSMFRARRLLIEGWYSTNFLGNGDGLVLDEPGSNKTKVLFSKAASCSTFDRGLPRRESPGAHPLLQAPGRLEGSLGQHRHRRLRGRADADQGQLPLPGLGARRAARDRPRQAPRCGEACGGARHPAAAVLLLQVAVSRARRDADPRPLQAGEALDRLGAGPRDQARRPHERRQDARGASRDHGEPVCGSDDLALLGGAPVLSKDSHRLWPIIEEEERRAVMRVLDRGILSGPFAPGVDGGLEEEFARFVGAKHCLVTHCGTSALLVALAAAGIKAGDEVIVPAYSFVATPLAVVQAGAIPVFADVDEATGCIDAAAAEAAVTSRTRAIMPVHMHGAAADMKVLLAVARRHDIVVVEDAAQAHGALFEGRPVGAIGAAGGFSLQSSKNLAAGEGGLFVTNDDAIAEEASAVRNFGQDLSRAEAAEYDLTRPLDGTRSLDARRLGSMYRGNEMMAAFARAQLAKLPERLARCQKNAERLSLALAALPGVTAPKVPAGRTSVHHKYRVHLDPQRAGLSISPGKLRDVVAQALRAEGLEVVLWQSVPFRRRRSSSGETPRAATHGRAKAGRTSRRTTIRRATRRRRSSSRGRSSCSRSRARSSRSRTTS